MEALWTLKSPSELDAFIRTETEALAKDAAKYLQIAIPADAAPVPGEAMILKSPNTGESGYVASILFLGPVFGEFIISVEDDTAERLFAPLLEGATGNEKVQLICETLAEVLNQCAGRRMNAMNQTFKRMTMSVPKITHGKIMYRGIRSASAQIATHYGSAIVSMYIDQMKTELADAHQEIIFQLRGANSDLEKVNLRIREQQAQLVQSEKMASLGILAAGVAHEINNPLSFVTANIETLNDYVTITTRLIDSYSTFIKNSIHKDQDESRSAVQKLLDLEEKEEISYITEDSRKLLEESRGGLDRISRIVSGLKRFSRQESDDFRPAQINEELKNTLEILRSELKYRCRIETDYGKVSELPCIAGELSQVFMNLILNASQAVPESGGVVHIETREEDNQLVIRFRDNGSGMSPEVMEKVFQPFFTTKPVGKGTGLGLAISYGIVERHAGKIEITSRVGQGSTFTVRLPYPPRAA